MRNQNQRHQTSHHHHHQPQYHTLTQPDLLQGLVWVQDCPGLPLVGGQDLPGSTEGLVQDQGHGLQVEDLGLDLLHLIIDGEVCLLTEEEDHFLDHLLEDLQDGDLLLVLELILLL